MIIINSVESLISCLINIVKNGIVITTDDHTTEYRAEHYYIVLYSPVDEKTRDHISNTVIDNTKTDHMEVLDINTNIMKILPYTFYASYSRFVTGNIEFKYQIKRNMHLLSKQYKHFNMIWYDTDSEIFKLQTVIFHQTINMTDFKKHKIADNYLYLFEPLTNLLGEVYISMEQKLNNSKKLSHTELYSLDIYTENKLNSHVLCHNCGVRLFDNVYIICDEHICLMCIVGFDIRTLKNNIITMETHINKLSDIIDEKSKLYNLVRSFKNSKVSSTSSKLHYVITDNYLGIQDKDYITYLTGVMYIPESDNRDIILLKDFL